MNFNMILISEIDRINLKGSIIDQFEKYSEEMIDHKVKNVQKKFSQQEKRVILFNNSHYSRNPNF